MGPALIAEGQALVEQALASAPGRAPTRSRPPSPPSTRRPPRPPATDWGRIVGLYDLLARVAPSPVVDLNRAVAVAMRDGPRAGSGPHRRPPGARRPGGVPPGALRARRPLPPPGQDGRGPGLLPQGAGPGAPRAGAEVPGGAAAGSGNKTTAPCRIVAAPIGYLTDRRQAMRFMMLMIPKVYQGANGAGPGRASPRARRRSGK